MVGLEGVYNLQHNRQEAGWEEDPMNSRMLTVLAVVFCMTATSSASAEQGSGERSTPTKVTVRLPEKGLDPAVRDCLRRCIEGQTPECARARQGARDAWRRLLGRLSSYESRITVLEGRIGGLSDRDPDLDAQLDELRDRIAQLNVRIDELNQLVARIDQLEGRVGRLEEGNTRQDTELEAVRARVARLEAQIANVGRRNGVVQLGFSLGGTYLYSLDGTQYSGGLVGVRLALRFTRMASAFVELQAALSYSESPAGLRGRGGVQLEFARGRVVLEAGVSALWVGYDQHLDASSAFLSGDIGVEYRPHPIVGLGLAYVAGVEFDSCGTAAFATGGVATLGIYIPWW
jgi:hypothetical protein